MEKKVVGRGSKKEGEKNKEFKLSDIHYRMFKYQYAGYSGAKVGKILGKNPNTVRKWAKEPLYIKRYNEYKEKVTTIEDTRVEYLAGIVNDQFEELLTNRNVENAVKLRAVELYYKRRGLLVENVKVSGELGIKDLSDEELRRRVEELRKELGEKKIIEGAV